MNYCSMTIQSRKKMYNKTVSEEELSRKFSRLMMEGKLNAAIRLLEGSSPIVLPLTDLIICYCTGPAE